MHGVGKTNENLLLQYERVLMNTNTFTKAQMLEMFNDGTGFTGAGLNTSGKKMGNKTAASPLASATVKPLFDAMITDFADNVIPNWATDASNGQAGVLTDATRTIHVNAKGHEIDQTFNAWLAK